MEVAETEESTGSSPALERLHPRFPGQARVSEMIRVFWPFTSGRRHLIAVQIVLSIGLFGATALIPLQTGRLLTAALSTASADTEASHYVVDPIEMQRLTQAVLAPELETAAERRIAGIGIRAAGDQLRVANADGTLDAIFPGDLAYRTAAFPAIEDASPGWEEEAAAIVRPDHITRADLDAMRDRALATPSYATNRAFNWVVSLLLTDPSAKQQRDDWRNHRFRADLFGFAGLLLAVFVLRALTLVLAQRATLAGARRLQDAVFERVHDAALVDAGALARPSMVSRCTTYVDRVTNALLKAQTEGVPSVAALLFSAGFLLYIDIPIGLIMIGVVVVFEIVRRLMSNRWSKLAHERLDLNTSLSELVDGSIAASSGIRGLRAQTTERRRFAERADDVMRHTRRLEVVAETFRLTAFGFGQIAVLVVIAVVGFVRQDLNLAEATAVVLYVREVSASLQELPGMIVDLQEAAPYMRRLRRVLGAALRRVEPSAPHPMPSTPEQLAFDRVTFLYADGSPGCEDVSFTATRQQWTVLTGLDASGIHAVVELAAALESPDRGCIEVGGVDVASLAGSDLGALITVLPSLPAVLEGTLAANIGSTRPDATRADIERVAALAGLEPWLDALGDGLDSIIGRPRQHVPNELRARIGVARVLISNAPVIVIDDPTGVLDREVAGSLWAALRGALSGRIVLASTTQLERIADTDAVLTFDSGSVVERGSRQGLLEAHGHFSRLWSRLVDGSESVAELSNVPALSALSPDVLRGLADRLVTERFEAGDVVFDEGEPADRVFLVVDGIVDLLSGERRVSSVRNGHYFGDFDLAQATIRTGSARARTTVVVRSLHRLAVSRGLAGALERPEYERTLYTWLTRRGSATRADIDGTLSARIDVPTALAGLLADGSITESASATGEPEFRVSRALRQRARSTSLLATLFPD